MAKRKTFNQICAENPKQPKVVFKILKSEARDKLNRLAILINYAEWVDIDPWGDAGQLDDMCRRLDQWIEYQLMAQKEM